MSFHKKKTKKSDEFRNEPLSEPLSEPPQRKNELDKTSF
jgi:hypothetical protein